MLLGRASARFIEGIQAAARPDGRAAARLFTKTSTPKATQSKALGRPLVKAASGSKQTRDQETVVGPEGLEPPTKAL